MYANAFNEESNCTNLDRLQLVNICLPHQMYSSVILIRLKKLMQAQAVLYWFKQTTKPTYRLHVHCKKSAHLGNLIVTHIGLRNVMTL